MAENIDIKSLVRISTIAKANGKSPAWVKKLADKGEIDLVYIDGFYFARMNEKLRKYIK